MRKLFFIFSCLLLSACTPPPDEAPIPDSVLPEQKMADVMVDIHLLEAVLNVHQVGIVDKSGGGMGIKINLFKKHGITREEFEKSYTYYTEKPEHLVEVYQLVLNDLSKMQAEVGKKK